MPKSTALLICADSSVVNLVEEVSSSVENLHFEVYGTIDEACSQLHRYDITLVLAHLPSTSDDAAVTRLLWKIAASHRPIGAVMLTDRYREHQAVSLLRAGAADYLELPLSLPKLAYLMEALTLRARVDGQVGPATREPPVRYGTSKDAFYVLSPEMVELMEQIRRVAPQDTTILLTGETGTGKTRLARLIHELSPRRDEPFLVVDCGALSPNLIESEMFGHVKGAFTGADRDRAGKFTAVGQGTLLLDEINSLPPTLQAKLLRAVDERIYEPVGSNKSLPLRARLIAISNTLLDREVAAGRFRSDLYYRLNVVGFYLPPLRDWRCVIPALAKKLLAEFAAASEPEIRGVSSDALLALEQYDWPGNIRELRNVIERAVALCLGPEIQVSDLPEAVRRGNAWAGNYPIGYPRPAVAAPSAPLTLNRSKEEAEIRRITEALRKHRNNRLRAAAELGISRMALYKKLHKYGLASSR